MPFSIANSPCNEGTIELHIKVAPFDEATQTFITQTTISSPITLSGPFGTAYVKKNPDTLLLIAAGTGFAAAKAMIETLIKTYRTQRCHLLWTVSEKKDFYLEEVIEQWQQQLPHLLYTPICSQIAKRKIVEEVVHRYRSFENCQIYVFGPHTLALEMYQTLTANGLANDQYFSDML